jgi:predicted nucleotidyltransferase
MDKTRALKLAHDYVGFLISQRSYKIKEAFLFGSYAANNFNDDSDIDIALVLADYNDTIKELSNLMRLRRKFDLRIEPHPVVEEDFRVESPFVKEIKKGLKIKIRKTDSQTTFDIKSKSRKQKPESRNE